MVPMWERTAMTHFVMGRYDKAEEYFLKIREAQPKKFGIVHHLGLVSLAQDKFEEAEKAFLSELENFGEVYIRVKALADTYYLWGKREESRKYYERTLALCQNDVDKRLIAKRIEQAKDEAAFAEAMRSIRELKQGNRYMAGKHYDDAYECFKRASEIDPYNFQAFNNLGALEIHYRKNTEKAIRYFEKAVRLTSLPAILGNLNHAKSLAAKKEGKG